MSQLGGGDNACWTSGLRYLKKGGGWIKIPQTIPQLKNSTFNLTQQPKIPFKQELLDNNAN